MTGSGIFVANGENDEAESGIDSATPNNKTGVRMYQVNHLLRREIIIEIHVYLALSFRWKTIDLILLFGFILQQAIAGISHISFGDEESVSPKKPATLPEVAKQRELSGTLDSDADAKLKKQLSDAKCKELSGHDIFAPPPEILPRPTTARTLDLKGSIDIGDSSNVSNSVKFSYASEFCVCALVWM